MNYRIVMNFRQGVLDPVSINFNIPKIDVNPYDPITILQYVFDHHNLAKDILIISLYVSDAKSEQPLSIFRWSKTNINIIYASDDTKRGLSFPIYKDNRTRGGCKSIW